MTFLCRFHAGFLSDLFWSHSLTWVYIFDFQEVKESHAFLIEKVSSASDVCVCMCLWLCTCVCPCLCVCVHLFMSDCVCCVLCVVCECMCFSIVDIYFGLRVAACTRVQYIWTVTILIRVQLEVKVIWKYVLCSNAPWVLTELQMEPWRPGSIREALRFE